MKIALKELLPADISNESALHLVNFMRALALAIKSTYFDKLLLNGVSLCSEELKNPMAFNPNDEPNPF